jgi:hypothetical protein
MEWNANGLLQHKDELQAILSSENIDICLISKTHFTSESHIKFQNYVIYHTVHSANMARGGIAVIIRDTIKHYEEEKRATRDIKATSVTIVTTKQTLTLSRMVSSGMLCHVALVGISSQHTSVASCSLCCS